MANIEKNIRTLRTANKMTQDDLAEKLFVSRQTISNYETGKSNPDIDMLIKIAEILNSDVNTLIYGLPESSENKKKYLKLILSCTFTLLLGIVSFVLLKNIARLFVYSVGILYWLQFLLTPCFYFMLGQSVTQIFILLFKAKPLSLRYSALIRHLILGLLIAYFIMVCPYVIMGAAQLIQYIQLQMRFQTGEIKELSINHSYSFFPAWDFAAWKIMYVLLVWKLYILFVIPGAVLQLTKQRTSS